MTFEDIRKEALDLELKQLETAGQPTCMATSSASTPTPPPVANWKQELRAEIMKDVKEQVTELSKTLLDELRRGRPSGSPFSRERSYSEGAPEQERRSARPPLVQGSSGMTGGGLFAIADTLAGHISRQCGPRRASQEGF